MNNKDSLQENPQSILQAALRQLEIFSQADKASYLQVDPTGDITSSNMTRLKKIRDFSLWIFDNKRCTKELELNSLKNAIIDARRTIQKYCSLMNEFENGDVEQRLLAEKMTEIIQKFNTMITTDQPVTSNYQIQCLLKDPEIKDNPIHFPQKISIKYDAVPETLAAKAILQEMALSFSKTDSLPSVSKPPFTNVSIVKENHQFMKDIFKIKALRLGEKYLELTIPQIVKCINETPIEIEETPQGLIQMKQRIQTRPGEWTILTGSFSGVIESVKSMGSLPILNDFKLSLQVCHSGFPYSSQYLGWALCNQWIEVTPLMISHLPAYQEFEQEKKQLADLLLNTPEILQHIQQTTKLKRQIFDENRHLFVAKHRQLHRILFEKLNTTESTSHTTLFDAFYKRVLDSSSPFDFLTNVQERLLNAFVRNPTQQLEASWLKHENEAFFSLDMQEKLVAAQNCLQTQRAIEAAKLNTQKIEDLFILEIGHLLGTAYQTIYLQYLSEKLEFAPPFFKDFERRLQACAFQQQLHFIQEIQHLQLAQNATSKEMLIKEWDKIIVFLQKPIEDKSRAFSIVNELEIYYNERFFRIYHKK